MTLFLGLGIAGGIIWHDMARYHNHLSVLGSWGLVVAGAIAVAGLVRFPW